MKSFVSHFATHIEDMLCFKEALGYSRASYESFLYDIDRFRERNFPEETEFTQELVLSWARLRPNESVNTLTRRIAAIREFARYLNSIEVEAYVLPERFAPARQVYVPHIYNSSELRAFFNAADKLGKPEFNLIAVIFRVIYCCGLRPTEVLRIKKSDFDLNSGRINIIESKRHKDRIVYVSDDLLKLCIRYNDVVRCLYGESQAFFRRPFGQSCNAAWLRQQFANCCELAEISRTQSPRPRIYDFRHTFATMRLQLWLEEGKDLYAMLPYLSAYMGHTHISCTTYYLHLLPERLATTSAIDWDMLSESLPEVPYV